MTYLRPAGWAEVATRGDLAELRDEPRGAIANLRIGLRGEIADVRTEIAHVRSDTADLRATILRENRTLLFGLIGVFTAYAAGLVAAARLH